MKIPGVGVSEVTLIDPVTGKETSSLTFNRSRDDYRASLDAMLYIGLSIPLAPRFTLSPRLSYTYPATGPLGNDDVELATVGGLLGLEWSL